MNTGLTLEDGVVRYRVDGYSVWELPVAGLRVVGEGTTANGPYLDDYFLCFAADADTCYEAPFEGAFLRILGVALGHEFSLRLVGSTEFNSNVLWPPRLEGRPMFVFAFAPAATWCRRLIGEEQYTQQFSDEVLVELRKSGGD